MKLTIDLTETAASNGDEYYPGSLEDRIVSVAARQLVGEYDRDSLARKVEHMVTEQLAGIVHEVGHEVVTAALEKPIRQTDRYGSPIGEPQPLAAWIEAELVKQMQVGSNRDAFGDRTKLAEFIRTEVDRKLEGELRGALDAAKSEVLDALRAKGNEVLAAAMRKALPL